MFVSHLEILSMIQQQDHQARLSAAVQARQASKVHLAPATAPSTMETIRFRLGSVLVNFGCLLQGTTQVGVAGPSLPGIGPTSWRH